MLARLGIEHAWVRQEIKARWRAADDMRAWNRGPNHVPFTDTAKRVLELALREAISLGHNYIGTEHVLLGMTRVDAQRTVELLRDAGVTPEAIRHEVIQQLEGRLRPKTPEDTDTARADRPVSAKEIEQAVVGCVTLFTALVDRVKRNGFA